MTNQKNFPYLTQYTILAAITITFINDIYLKSTFPGSVTGKISDFSGLYYAPFFFYALGSFVRRPFGQHQFLNKKIFLLVLLAVHGIFVLLKVTPLRDVFVFYFSKILFVIHVANDPTDLIALIVAWPSYLSAAKFFRKPVRP